MVEIKIIITRYLGDDPQPGIVECELVDAHGRRWRFVEKTAIVEAGYIDGHSDYPRPGCIAAILIERFRDPSGTEIVRVDTSEPYGIESIDGVSRFDVRPKDLVE